VDCSQEGLEISDQYFNRFPKNGQYGRLRAADTIDTIVLHEGAKATSIVKSERWKSASISTHFVIEWDGTVYQMMDIEHTGHHTGSGENINRRSIGVDLMTTSIKSPCNMCSQAGTSAAAADCSYRPELVSSTDLLVKCLSRLYPKATHDYRHVIGHFEYGKHGDPRRFPWSEIGIAEAEKKKAKGWLKNYGPTDRAHPY